LIKDEDILEKTDKTKALAGLHTHTGWKHLQHIMREETKRLQRELTTIDPNDNTGIAGIQAKLEMLRKYIDKPELHFHKYNNGG